MIKLKNLLLERQIETPKFKTGEDILDFIDSNVPEWKKYKIKDRGHEEVQYRIPLKLVKQTFGWTPRHIEDINKKLVPYVGGISVENNYVELWGEG